MVEFEILGLLVVLAAPMDIPSQYLLPTYTTSSARFNYSSSPSGKYSIQGACHAGNARNSCPWYRGRISMTCIPS